MEEEAPTILPKAVLSEETTLPLGTRFRALFARVGLERPIPALRGDAPRAASFDEDRA